MPIEQNTIDRLAVGRDLDGQPFLAPSHLQAADRLERLIARARLAPRLTMSYDAAPRQRQRSGNGAAEISDSAAQARQHLNRLAAGMPADCWGVLFDVCGLGKGLQSVEAERRWPRRSAKLVLRISLSQLAAQFGLDAQATGADNLPVRGWRDGRLPIISRTADPSADAQTPDSGPQSEG